MSGLQLGELEFEIEKATISGWLNTLKQDYCVGLQWSLEFCSVEREFEEDFWQPQFSVLLPAAGIRGWTDLAGLSRRWSGAEAEAQGIEAGFYAFAHEGVSRGTLDIGRREGTAFDIAYSGVTDVHWDERLGADVPFALSCTAVFTGITVLGDGDQTDASLASLLGAETALEALDQGPIRTQRHKPGNPRGLGPTVANWLLPARRADIVRTLADFAPRVKD